MIGDTQTHGTKYLLVPTTWLCKRVRCRARSVHATTTLPNDFVRVEHTHMHEVLPDARLAVVPGATHVGLLHETDLVMPILRRFLDD
jgi:pimeloyl-ACP methyl ester carboxylesterase